MQSGSRASGVQRQLGHASPATTANLYADISFGDMRDGMNDLYVAD